MGWLRLVLVAATVLATSWLVLAIAAKRLPPGALRDAATVLPATATTIRSLRTDPRVPRRVKVVVALALVWLLSPIDLLPEFLPVIGPLDDVIVVALALRYASRRIPRAAIEAAWPAEPRLLERLIGPPPADVGTAASTSAEAATTMTDPAEHLATHPRPARAEHGDRTA